MPTVRKKRRIKKMRVLLVSVIFIIVLAAIITAGWVLSIAATLPDVSETNLTATQSSALYDQEGELYGNLNAGENRSTVDISQMPQSLIDAFVSTEDIRFYDHFGVDVKRVFGALFKDITSRSKAQGGSTITMQLARNAILEDQQKKLTRKVKEALLAIEIEKHYSKDEILSLYLNEIYFDGAAYGVQAASKMFFHKDVSELNLEESALLAGVIRNPGIYSPYYNMENAIKVRNTVLGNMHNYKPDVYTDDMVEEARATEINVYEKGASAGSYAYPWFTDYVIESAVDIMDELDLDQSLIYTGGLQIYTTLDPTVQTSMEKIYSNDDNFPSSATADQVESSMVVMDVTNGEVRGVIGGRDYTTKRGFNRGVDLERQPGSTIKPIAVYGPALEAGYSPASVVNDAPTTFGSSYSPKNYDGKWRGLISMRTSIMFSVNMSAVKFMQAMGSTKGWDFARKVGLPLSQDDNNLALALGGITTGVSPLEMAGAYATFANQGVYSEPCCITMIKDAKGGILYEHRPNQTAVMSEQSAYLVTDMLMSVTTGGTGTNAKMNRPVASKTGTVQLPNKPEFAGKTGNKDAWFAAYTPELVGVVWMGYDNEKDDDGTIQYLKQIYGGKYPALIWKQVMTASLKDVPVKAFTMPSGLTSVQIDTKSGLLPSSLTPTDYIKSELFNGNNVPTAISDVWEMVKICPDSGKLATDYCPNAVTRVRLKNNGASSQTADYLLYTPTITCPLHTTPLTGMVAVKICTDPRHNGEEVLANIAQDGQSGGCPSEYIETKYYYPDQVPTKYCDLEDHQIVGSTGGSNNGNNKGKDELATPYNLQVSSVSTGCKLTWWDDYNDPGETLYIVERVTNSDKSAKTKFSTYGTTYTDTTVVSGNTYQYRIYAYAESSKKSSDWSTTVKISY